MAAIENLQTVNFSAKGDVTSWFSSTYQNQDNIIEFVLSPDSDWEGIVVIDRSHASPPSSKYSEVAIMGVGGFSPSVIVRDDKEGVKYRARCAVYVTGSADIEIAR